MMMTMDIIAWGIVLGDIGVGIFFLYYVFKFIVKTWRGEL